MALENPTPRETLNFVQAKHLKKGDTIKGFLLGDWTAGKYKKRDLKMQASEDFTIDISPEKGAPAVATTIKAGDKFIMPTAGTLSKFWDSKDVNNESLARVGTLYHFVYGGQEKIKKGEWAGNEAHVFEILRDVDKTIEVSEVAHTTEASEDLPF